MDQVHKTRVAPQGIKVRMNLDQLQDVGLLQVGPLQPGKCLLVVIESQISIHKGSGGHVACLLSSLQLINQAKSLATTPRMGIGPNQHAHYSRIPIAAERLFQYRNRLVRLSVGNQGESQKPMVRVVVAQLPDGLVVTSRVKQNKTVCDGRASKRCDACASKRIELAGTPDPCQGLVRPPLTEKPLRVPYVSTSIVRVQL